VQNRPADRTERLTRCSETKSGGGINAMTSLIIADMNFVLIYYPDWEHRGEERENISVLEKDNLTW
jgi:hypothetical protein